MFLFYFFPCHLGSRHNLYYKKVFATAAAATAAAPLQTDQQQEEGNRKKNKTGMFKYYFGYNWRSDT